MELILKQYNIPLLRFSATNDSSTPEIEVHWINEDQRHLLPLDMELSPEGISRWMRRRTIPRNRAYVNRLLAKCGLNANRPMGILALCKGLSVDDSYWVVEDGFEGTFERYNLFENRFSEVLALIAFTGYGSSNRSSLASSPEFTTNGMLPKCWRNGKVGSAPPASCLPTSTMPICPSAIWCKEAVSMRLPLIMKIWANRSRRLSAICWCLMRSSATQTGTTATSAL